MTIRREGEAVRDVMTELERLEARVSKLEIVMDKVINALEQNVAVHLEAKKLHDATDEQLDLLTKAVNHLLAKESDIP